MASLLPPNSTPLERAIEATTARISDVPVPLRTLWNPATCPEATLPWLGWALSVDRWDLDWTTAQKRAACAGAFAAHRIKGTRAAVDAVLEEFGNGMTIDEWWEQDPPGVPHTFAVTIPGGFSSLPAGLIDKIVREIAKAKPVRSHFQFNQGVAGDGTMVLAGGARAVIHMRVDFDCDVGVIP